LSKEGRPGPEQSYTYSKERGGSYKESAESTLRAPLTLEQQDWYERSHGRLVKTYRKQIQEESQELQRVGQFLSAEDIIHLKLENNIKKSSEEQYAFYATLSDAWDALAYDRYEPGSSTERAAGCRLGGYSSYSGKTTIELYNQELIWAIDAMAEAVGIPHKRGQREIEIPEKLRNYFKYVTSKEYKELVTKTRQDRISEFKKLTS
jgi:hypothetical protein